MEQMTTVFEDSKDYAAYIKSKNLTIDSVEKILSFFDDREFCRENWWFKKEVVRYVYGERFSEVWPQVVEAFKRRSHER